MDAATLLDSGLIAAGSGSAGSETLSRNSSGIYLRERVVPTDPRTALQIGRRNAMMFLWSRWLSSGTERKIGWKLYGRTDVRRNKAGYTYYLSGWQAFVSVNFARFMAALAILLIAPAFRRADSLSLVSVIPRTLFPRISVVFNETDEWVTEREARLLIFASASTSPTINWFRGPYQFAGQVRGNPTNPPTSPFVLGAGPFFLVPSDHWFGRAYTLRRDGRQSPVQFLGPTVIGN